MIKLHIFTSYLLHLVDPRFDGRTQHFHASYSSTGGVHGMGFKLRNGIIFLNVDSAPNQDNWKKDSTKFAEAFTTDPWRLVEETSFKEL